MDQSLVRAARAGNVKELYGSIKKDGNVLRNIDKVEFTDTPLHIAAAEGCIDFAMEILNLKPSFARKLNQDGLSPIHVAIKKGHKELVLRLVEFDKDVIRVRGKKGKTPLHYISKQGNQDGLVEKLVETCPECIRDVTVNNQTALHIATKYKKLDVVQALVRRLKKTDNREEEVNRKDKDGDTALHMAARNNQPQMIKLLLNCKADKYETNQAGLTALDVARQHNHIESITILQGCFNPRLSTFKDKLWKQIFKYVTMASAIIFRDMDRISMEYRNALLVVLGLLLTATYQASLSPPGSVFQGDAASSDHYARTVEKAGKSVMDQNTFLFFYIPACAVFIVTFFLTLALLKPFPRGFRTALQVLLAFLAVCFVQAISFIAPTNVASRVIELFLALVFGLMMFMCIAYRVSKLSVWILGCWLFPRYLVNGLWGNIILGCLLFIFLYDEFWMGTMLVIGYCLLIGLPSRILLDPVIVFGCWLILSLCRFGIKRCNQRCVVFE